MLSLQGATLRRGRRVLVERIDLEVRPGELLAVLGPNGAGKSTVLAALCGDLVLAEGRACLDGRPLADWGRGALARRRAVLLQRSQIIFPFRAREVVAMGLLGRSRNGDALVAAAMQEMDVAHLAERCYTRLSGGEQQRTQLARTLVQLRCGEGTRYLLLDEPTSSLDIAHKLTILEQARTLARREGVGVLAILHDIELGARFADRLVLLKDGRIAAAGRPAEVLTAQTIDMVFGVRVQVLPHPTRPGELMLPLA